MSLSGPDRERLARIDDRTAQMHKAIFGNGRAGLIERMDVLETRQEECPARRRNWLAIGAFVVSVVTAATALYAVLT
jgi:hypothetical protein